MSLYSKKDAFLLGRKDTIDLKYMNAKEYVLQKEGKNTRFYFFIHYMKNIFSISAIIWFLIVFLIGWGVLTPEEVNGAYRNENSAFLERFPEKETKVVGCYNDYTQKVREGSRCTKKGDKNISLPPRDQVKVWLKYFTQQEIVNRLGIVNFESNFNENAKNAHAIGYVQTLRSHGVAKDIDSQLKWLSNRQKEQKKIYSGKSKRCGYYWENNNEKDGFTLGEYGVLACLYRYHYHATKGTAYAKRGIEATIYYKWYMYGDKGKTWEESRENTYSEILY